MNRTIDHASLVELFDYDPLTGIFIRKPRDIRWFIDGAQTAKHNMLAWNAKFAGTQAESTNTDTGYVRIGLFGKRILAHRLAWLYMTGSLPKEQIDHIDGNRANNKWDNLREANNAQNNRNGGLRVNNTSGFKGVYFNQGKWRAQITVDYKVKYLGTFSSAEEGHLAYIAASKKYHGEFGRVV